MHSAEQSLLRASAGLSVARHNRADSLVCSRSDFARAEQLKLCQRGRHTANDRCMRVHHGLSSSVVASALQSVGRDYGAIELVVESQNLSEGIESTLAYPSLVLSTALNSSTDRSRECCQCCAAEDRKNGEKGRIHVASLAARRERDGAECVPGILAIIRHEKGTPVNDESTERLSAAILRIEQEDALDEGGPGKSSWAQVLREHVELWLGDQEVAYVGHEWVYFDEATDRGSHPYADLTKRRFSQDGLRLADSMTLFVLGKVYVMHVTVGPAPADGYDPFITSSTLMRRSALRQLGVHPRYQGVKDRHGARIVLGYPGISSLVEMPPRSDSESMIDADLALIASLRDDFFASDDGERLSVTP